MDLNFSSYISIGYLTIFLPIVILLYSVIPQKHRWMVLLLASYLFFWTFSDKLIIYLLLSTLSIYFIGIWLSKYQAERDCLVKTVQRQERKKIKKQYVNKQRKVIALTICLHIGVLVILKYSTFLGTNINSLFAILKLPLLFNVPSFVMPIGISFYTLQALSYVFDVYRGTIKAEKNLGRLALYMAFFPQIMEGPICRYSNTAMQLWKGEQIEWENLTFGLQRILFGIMKKMVIADRLNSLIRTVFSNYVSYNGTIVAIAAIFYTCQLYMEFSGTMDVVIGSSEIFGVKMPENFKRPFFSKSISEFWARWHITLGTWFKDYIFYPLSMSKPLKKITTSGRKRFGNHYGPLIAGSIALFCVWFCNGIWHGAGWNYIFFGMYHFALILIGNILGPIIKSGTKKLHINTDSFAYRGMQIVRTACFVCIGELFFRAHGLRPGLSMFKNMVTNFSFQTMVDGSLLKLGMDAYDYLIIGITILIIFVISYMNEKGISVRKELSKKNIVIRWTLYYSLIMFIVIFGAYGVGYVPLDPIYANF